METSLVPASHEKADLLVDTVHDRPGLDFQPVLENVRVKTPEIEAVSQVALDQLRRVRAVSSRHHANTFKETH